LFRNQIEHGVLVIVAQYQVVMDKRSILIVEDEPIIRMELADHFEKLGFHVREAGSGDRAMEIIQQTEIDLVVTDIQMPGWQDGIGLALWVRQQYPHIKLIIVSGAASESAHLKQLGAEGVIVTKPYSVDELGARAETLLFEQS
jgi:DNA-binding response OmpR family regulator